jgi:hypothetical protein
MAKSRLAYVNLATASATTVTASSEVAIPARPASYLKSAARWKKWRSTTTTGDQWALFDFGSAQTIKVVAIVGYKRHSGGAIKAEYWNGAAYVTFSTYTIPSANPTGLLTVWNTTGISTSRIRVYFTNTGAVSDYVELGVVVTGTYYEPTFNVIDGFRVTPIDPSLHIAAADGQEETQSRTTYHQMQVSYDYMPDADFDGFRTVFTAIGSRTPILFALDPSDDDLNLYGQIASIDFGHRYGRNYDVPVLVREVR